MCPTRRVWRIGGKGLSVQQPTVYHADSLLVRCAYPVNEQTDQDWIKPGTRADREEMVRILVEDLKASVTVLDMHDYRLGGCGGA